jgi:hypothetical protein
MKISPEFARKVREALEPSLTPVKSIASRRWLSVALLTVSLAGSAALVALMSKAGLHLMTAIQVSTIFAILVGGGILFAVQLSRQMIPGSRPVVPFPRLLALCGVAFFGGLTTLFPWQASGSLVSEGLPCAVMELAIAIAATAGFWLLARRGALFASAGLGATLTGLAAFLALIPLQSQCMFQQAPHLLVWHGGSALLMVGFGALVGNLRRGRWSS